MYSMQAEAGPSTSLVLSSMAITDAFDVASIVIDNLSILHPQIGALKVCDPERNQPLPDASPVQYVPVSSALVGGSCSNVG